MKYQPYLSDMSLRIFIYFGNGIPPKWPKNRVYVPFKYGALDIKVSIITI